MGGKREWDCFIVVCFFYELVMVVRSFGEIVLVNVFVFYREIYVFFFVLLYLCSDVRSSMRWFYGWVFVVLEIYVFC